MGLAAVVQWPSLIKNGVLSLDEAKRSYDVEPLQTKVERFFFGHKIRDIDHPLLLELGLELFEDCLAGIVVLESVEEVLISYQGVDETEQEHDEFDSRTDEAGIEDSYEVLLAWIVRK